MNNLDKLIKEYKETRTKMYNIQDLIRKESDGHGYVTILLCYGSRTVEEHKNFYTVEELSNDYYGDNGIVNVYTTNPDLEIDDLSGDLHIVDKAELNLMANSEKISMSKAIGNWITLNNTSKNYSGTNS